MTEGPLGGARRLTTNWSPGATGYFRTYEEKVNSQRRSCCAGYHKPIMLAGGIGNIRADHVQKGEIVVGAKIVLGGPAMNIGLGGGRFFTASGQSDADLDFGSVQRDNPKWNAAAVKYRPLVSWATPTQSCLSMMWARFSNAMPELVVSDGGVAGNSNCATFLATSGHEPAGNLRNESRERYVLAVAADQLPLFGRTA